MQNGNFQTRKIEFFSPFAFHLDDTVIYSNAGTFKPNDTMRTAKIKSQLKNFIPTEDAVALSRRRRIYKHSFEVLGLPASMAHRGDNALAIVDSKSNVRSFSRSVGRNKAVEM